MPQLFLISGAISCLISIVLGALAAHALKAKLEPNALESFQVAVDYQMSQGLGLILIALIASRFSEAKLLVPAGNLILIGSVLFWGSIYVLTLTSFRYLGPINFGLVTPLGGVIMITGWVCFVFAAFNQIKL